MQESLIKIPVQTKYPRASVPDGIGERIAAERQAACLSQAELGRLAGVTRETIYRVEAGRIPSSRTVFALQAALDVDYLPLVVGWPLPADPDFPCFGARVRRRRREMGLSLDEVAKAIRVSAATLSRFETEQANPRGLVDVSVDAKGDLLVSIRSDALAKCLGFGSAADLTRYCNASTFGTPLT